MSVIARPQQVSLDRVEPAGGEFDMVISEQERVILARAMHALVQEDSRGFCDILWLGMGDRWQDVLKQLTDARHVRITDGEAADGILITERGRALATNLNGPLRQSA